MDPGSTLLVPNGNCTRNEFEKARRQDREDQLEVCLVVEAAVSAANDSPVAAHVISEPNSRCDVVAIEEFFRRIRKLGVVELGDRLDFQVVPQPEADRRAVRDAPFVLSKGGDEVRLLIAIERAGHANRQPLGVRPRIVRVEELVSPEPEGAIRVVLRRRPGADVFVLAAEPSGRDCRRAR